MKRLLVKVCGMTRPQDARLAAALGADLLGFIFHPGSPRHVAPELPAGLDKGADLLSALKVGVFVGQSVDETRELMDAGRLDLAQLHGGQDEAFCKALGESLGSERIIKVLWPERATTVDAFQAEVDRFASFCRLFLVDAGRGGGGHGRGIESGSAAEILAATRFPRPWLLAGGLGPDTIGPLLSRFSPSGLDLNSGVESAPGIKDKTKLRAAFDALRAAKKKGENP
jgi:phosphoribosylanthranilate isomerase